MSAPIRPLPVEAAPQRTESALNSKPDERSGFADVLDLHLGEKVEEKKEEPTQGPEKKPKDVDPSVWAMLGIQLTNPPLIVETPNLILAERGHSCPQDGSAMGAEFSAVATVEVGEIVDRPQSDGLADTNVRAPSLEIDGTTTPKADISPLVQKLAPAPLEQKLPPAPDGKSEDVAGKPVETGEKVHGIPVAKQAAVLLKMEKQDRSGSQEQQPGRFQVPQIEAASEQARIVNRPILKTVQNSVEFPAEKTILGSANFTAGIRLESPSALPETQRVTEIRAVAVVDGIRDQVSLLRASKANELNVVLRPDANTELVLQLRHVDGQVHLQARCERGDFTWLDSQWSAIQNSLAQQGVRVEPLQAAYRAQDGGGNSMFTSDERGSRQREERSFPLEHPSSKNSKNSSRPAKTGTRMRGWQSWA
jgi:hypothetical protein